MQDKSICKGRKAAALAVLPKLYEKRTVDNVADDTAAHFTDESGFFAMTPIILFCSISILDVGSKVS